MKGEKEKGGREGRKGEEGESQGESEGGRREEDGKAGREGRGKMGKMETVKLLQSDVLTNTKLDSLCTDNNKTHFNNKNKQ